MDLQLCVCSEVCPGVGTIGIEVSERRLTGVEVELCSVKAEYTLLAVLLPTKLRFAWEACSLGNDLPKEIKMARHFQLFNNYRYVHRLPEVQFSQLKQAISALGSAVALTEAIQVHFATLQDPFRTWVERYKVYVALCQGLKTKQNLYPISVDQFLACASFGTVTFYIVSLDRDAYANFLDE
ncbi:hypothetical protein Taro_003388 [Colocasia esculenta]|uniref:Uncharacterized protein n=1 Tax=Colocasia esculenta TaxID=4460 RepID=A0A843TNT7_COLES|nr:hypothetical protein [Colocasia esculenta]